MKPDKEYTGRATIRMYNCDCMELMQSGKMWGLAIVDPPYGIGASEMVMGKGKTKKYKQGKRWDYNAPDKLYFKVLKETSENQIIWGGNYFNLPINRGWIFWDKGLNGKSSFSDGELAWTSFDSVLRKANIRYDGFLGADEQRIHPTQKPVKLYKWLLTNYAKPGDTILDTHGGSLSIAIACWDLGFDLDICELDKDYFDAAVKRFENHISQQTLFETRA